MSKAPVAVAPVQLNLGEVASATPAHVTLAEIATAARENAGRILATALALALAAASLALVIPRFYESSTRILIDPRGMQVVEKDVNPRSGNSEQSISIVESEMRVLYSDNVLRAVMEREALAADPEFNGRLVSMDTLFDKARGIAKSVVGIREQPTAPDLAALRYLQRAIRVRREPQSYVIDLAVATRDPAKSQAIADRIAQEYVQTRFQTQAAATQRVSDAMSGRLDSLRRTVVAAEDEVERFKRQNNIVGVSGRLVNEQQLAELNTQLVIARNEATKAGDLAEQITRLRRSGIEADALPEALRSETIARLRTQYAAIRRREAGLSATVLASHPLQRQVQRELADARRLISEELNRIADNSRLEAERARSNEKALEKSFEDLKTLASTTNEKTVKMRQLEREAEAHRSVYSSFLVRSRELSEQTGVDTALATVLSPAVPPRGPKPPTLLHLLAAGLVSGLGLGLYNALRRLRSDPRVRGELQLAQITGPRRISVVPRLAEALGRHPRWLATARDPAGSGPGVPVFVTRSPDAQASVAMARLSTELNARNNNERPQIVLVTAAGDYEGKSTVAVNAALAAAEAGDSVLLVDADGRAKGVSRLFEDGDTLPGLFDVANGRREPAAVIVRKGEYPVDILPLGDTAGERPTRIAATIASLARPYDLVVIDAGVLMRDRLVSELAASASQILLVARDSVTVKSEYASAFEILDRTGKVRPVFLTDR